MKTENTQPRFIFQRRIDGVTYHYEPCETKGSHSLWKRVDKELWVTYLPELGWACVDRDKNILGLPWAISIDKQHSLPPAGTWVSRKGDKSYVYDVIYS